MSISQECPFRALLTREGPEEARMPADEVNFNSTDPPHSPCFPMPAHSALSTLPLPEVSFQ